MARIGLSYDNYLVDNIRLVFSTRAYFDQRWEWGGADLGLRFSSRKGCEVDRLSRVRDAEIQNL